MSELGQVLQRAREEKGISLDDIQKITKIQRRYLEAIERGHFHVLPGHFYARAFIKSYAEAVGLDPNHILSHFQSDLPAQPPQEQLERIRRRRTASANDTLQTGRWVTRTLLVLFVGLIIGVIYLAFVNNSNYDTSPTPGNAAGNQPQVQTPNNPASTPPPASVTPPPATTTPGQTVDPTAGTETPIEEKATLTFDSQQGATYNYLLTGAEKITVKLKAVSNDCWIAVYEAKGKKLMEQGTIKKGEEKVFELGKTAYLKLGKPIALDISVNDSPIQGSSMKFFPSNLQIKIVSETQQQ